MLRKSDWNFHIDRLENDPYSDTGDLQIFVQISRVDSDCAYSGEKIEFKSNCFDFQGLKKGYHYSDIDRRFAFDSIPPTGIYKPVIIVAELCYMNDTESYLTEL